MTDIERERPIPELIHLGGKPTWVFRDLLSQRMLHFQACPQSVWVAAAAGIATRPAGVLAPVATAPIERNMPTIRHDP